MPAKPNMTARDFEIAKHLWKHHIPLKFIAEHIQIPYATVALYCRGLRFSGEQQLTAKELVKKVLINLPQQVSQPSQPSQPS